MIQIALSKLQQFVSVPYEMELAPRLHIVHGHLQKGNGVGGEFTGWVHLPESYDRAEFARIEQAAQKHLPALQRVARQIEARMEDEEVWYEMP